MPAPNQKVLSSWLSKKIRASDVIHPDDWHPAIKDFRGVIEGDPELYMLFHMMFEQIPEKPPYCNDPSGKPQVKDYMTLLSLFNHIIQTTCEWEDHHWVGFPINAVLCWPMGTAAGSAAFTNVKVNNQFKAMFDVWAELLQSPDSREHLTTAPNGWFGPAAMQRTPDFIDTFMCDPDAPHSGFTSFDDFFTRRFRDGVRPLTRGDDDAQIVSPSESTTYNISYSVKALDQFWLKQRRYSLYHMLAADQIPDLAEQFVGGTVYQAYVDTLDYHRYHSPVNGRIVRVLHVPGTYYAENPAFGYERAGGPASTASEEQAFLTAVATRALVFIQAREPVGLMCFMAVGMAEVSTCEVTVKEGDEVRKGQELGMFHFGGSTTCLVFRPEVRVVFDAEVRELGRRVLLNSPLGRVEDGPDPSLADWLFVDEARVDSIEGKCSGYDRACTIA
ncbi:hypothetical protein CONPUDRAFT_57480 [Coniophora puteana RWD-64-598 SS2]|uniref:L-tryptophan decarboxylase PsiD-like domain-containing protein n=1 Tax=Coniophora puteana (strain RWD-64-598) TaxID=741705 RepID=A0A5M3MN93_CONPW|nr:uncharacterized protein CONPUDRAFT_57480 [Coniophora puteana RWD-64-598 SS2]EIW80648.1 hypothetical protein CONPUDRAFT_57480 [Coniophora puteana RWD-64-598 SS2]